MNIKRIIMLTETSFISVRAMTANSVTRKVLQPLWNESSPRTKNCLAYSYYSYSRIGPKERAMSVINSKVILREDKMAVGAFGRATNHG